MKRTILIVLISIIIHVTFASVLFYDDFNREEGSAVGNDWVNIGPVNPIIENGSMKLTSTSLMGVKREFSDLEITSGIYYIGFDWKIESNNWLADAFPNSTITYLRHDYEGNLYYDNTSDFSDPVNIGDLPLNSWNSIKMKVNLDTNQFSVWFDENLVAENITGQTAADFSRFTFRAGNGSTVTQYVDNFIVYDENPPETPTNFGVVGSTNNVYLSWDYIDEDLITYKVYRSITSPAEQLLVELTGNETSYYDYDALTNTDYYYRISAVSMGLYESDFSLEVFGHLQPEISVSTQNISIDVGFDYDYNSTVEVSNSGGYDLIYSVQGTGSNDFGNGSDGDVIVGLSDTVYVDVSRSAILGVNSAGSSSIVVDNGEIFSNGDEIIIITMQNNDTNLATNTSGKHEFQRIIDIDSNTLFLSSNLQNSYIQSNTEKHQVIKINNYNNLTLNGLLTCHEWNGLTGGVVCFRVLNMLTISSTGSINTSAKGYVGGYRNNYVYGNYSGTCGESIITAPYVTRFANAGGGGGGDTSSGRGPYGGGGGGYGTNGINGTNNEYSNPTPGIGGVAYGSNPLNKLFLGSGGGAGSCRYEIGYGGAGGDGGGIIYVTANEIHNGGMVVSDGENGENGTYSYLNAGGGGGSGGTILIKTTYLNNTGLIHSDGGIRGFGGDFFNYGNNAQGGNGGFGRVNIYGEINNTGQISPDSYYIASYLLPTNMISVMPLVGVIGVNSSETLQISYRTSELGLGSHTDSFYIESNDVFNSPIDISLSIEVLPPIPQTYDNSNEMIINSFNQYEEVPFTIRNAGMGKLNYNVYGYNQLSDNVFTFSDVSGTIEQYSSEIINIAVDVSTLDDGIYDTGIYLLSNAQSPQDSLRHQLRLHKDTNPPLEPTNLTFEEDQSDMHQIYLAWDANTLADSVYSYQIYRRGTHDAEWSLKGNVDASQTWFIDDQFTGLDTTAVNYIVTAIDWVGNESEPSQEVLAWLQRFEAPAGLQLQVINNRHVKLDWTPVTQTLSGNEGNPSCYVIYRSEYPSPVESFYFVSAVEENTFTHQWAAWFNEENKLYYIVTAYGGDFEDILRYTSKDSVIQYGNLDSYIRNKKINNQGEFRKDISINKVKK